MQTSLRGIAKRALEYPMPLYEASGVEEPCTRKPYAGICERGVGKPAFLSRCAPGLAWRFL